MNLTRIGFNTVKECEKYINYAEDFPYNVDLQCGSRIVDGKSILGIMSFGFPKELELRFHTDDQAAIDEFLENIAFCVREDHVELAV